MGTPETVAKAPEYVRVDRSEILYEYAPEAPGTPLSVRYVRQVYRERCVGCRASILWHRWVAVRGAMANVRRLKRGRYGRCSRCASDRHRAEAAAEEAKAKGSNGTLRNH